MTLKQLDETLQTLPDLFLNCIVKEMLIQNGIYCGIFPPHNMKKNT